MDQFVDRELYFGLYFNTTRKDCKWRKEIVDDHFCDEDVKLYLINDGQEALVSNIYDIKKTIQTTNLFSQWFCFYIVQTINVVSIKGRLAGMYRH